MTKCETTQPWYCANCATEVDADFARCWQCGSAPGGEADPEFERAVGPVRDQTLCSHCAYPLRALTGQHCPECGSPFDPEKVDTLVPAPPDPDTEVERRSREWLLITVASWLLFILSGMVYSLINRAHITWELTLAATFAASIVAPIMFCSWFFRRKK